MGNLLSPLVQLKIDFFVTNFSLTTHMTTLKLSDLEIFSIQFLRINNELFPMTQTYLDYGRKNYKIPW